MGGTCSTHVGDEKCIRNFIRKNLREETTERNRCSWADNVKMDANVWTGFMWLRMGSSGGLFGSR